MKEDIDFVCDLEQAKCRDRKIYITDIAIKKVPYIKYYGFTEEQNRIMQELAKDVLLLSKEKMTAMKFLSLVILAQKIPWIVLGYHWEQSMK